MQQLSVGPLLLVLLIAAASAAVTSSLLAPAPSMPELTGRLPDTELADQLAALREQNRELNDRVATLELRPRASERAEAMVPSFQAEVRAWMKGSEKGVASPAVLQADVAEALETIRRQEEAEDQQVKQQRRREWIRSTIEKFAPDLGLDSYQITAMRDAWNEKAEADAWVGRQWEAGESDRESIGEAKLLSEEQLQTTLQGFLTQGQYEAYTEMIEGWRGGGK